MQSRVGMPTASQTARIITPKTLKPSAQQGKYIAELIAGWALNFPLDSVDSQWMDRGNELEAEARDWYAFEYMVAVREVGFCMIDGGGFGGSPDGLVGEDGGQEIKCPSAANHMAYYFDRASFIQSYRPQVQACLWITGRDWWDLVSYNEHLPKVVERIMPDVEFHDALAREVPGFNAKLDAAEAQYISENGKPKHLRAA